MSREPVHPGKILGDELKELGISATELSRQIKVPENRIPQIVAGKRNISADTALRLGKWFNMSATFWMNLQNSYELRKAEKEIGKAIKSIKPRAKEIA